MAEWYALGDLIGEGLSGRSLIEHLPDHSPQFRNLVPDDAPDRRSEAVVLNVQLAPHEAADPLNSISGATRISRMRSISGCCFGRRSMAISFEPFTECLQVRGKQYGIEV
ncbi:MAG: hypothetical protein M0P17_04760 [Methanoculleus sp.]|nr:hypothetical protein [Methanoculleus sp.]